MEKIRSRCYHLILYEEDNTHLLAIDFIQKNFDYCCILHDKDYDITTGELLKPHYHYILYFDNPVFKSSLVKQLKIKSNYIVEDSLKKGLLYLIHYNNKEKYQYSIDEVFGTLKDRLYTYLNNNIENESQCIILILNYLDHENKRLSLNEFVSYIVSNNLWSYYRRSQITFIKLLEEHNLLYNSKNM